MYGSFKVIKRKLLLSTWLLLTLSPPQTELQSDPNPGGPTDNKLHRKGISTLSWPHAQPRSASAVVSWEVICIKQRKTQGNEVAGSPEIRYARHLVEANPLALSQKIVCSFPYQQARKTNYECNPINRVISGN